MGKYIEDAPNTDVTTTDEVKNYLAQVTGYPAEDMCCVMFLAEIKGRGIAFGGNLEEKGMLLLLADATQQLYEALVNQRIADLVPDDLSELENPAA